VVDTSLIFTDKFYMKHPN